MKPKWETGKDQAERRAFSAFIIGCLEDELHQKTIESLTVFANADPATVDKKAIPQIVRIIGGRDFPPDLVERIGGLLGIDIAEIAHQVDRLQALGFEVSGYDAPKKRGVKTARSEAFQNAADDVPKIRALFFHHWKHRNRAYSPLAEEIAAERWSLSKKETDALIDKFQRKG